MFGNFGNFGTVKVLENLLSPLFIVSWNFKRFTYQLCKLYQQGNLLRHKR